MLFANVILILIDGLSNATKRYGGDGERAQKHKLHVEYQIGRCVSAADYWHKSAELSAGKRWQNTIMTLRYPKQPIRSTMELNGFQADPHKKT
jgi:hypothetical protein